MSSDNSTTQINRSEGTRQRNILLSSTESDGFKVLKSVEKSKEMVQFDRLAWAGVCVWCFDKNNISPFKVRLRLPHDKITRQMAGSTEYEMFSTWSKTMCMWHIIIPSISFFFSFSHHFIGLQRIRQESAMDMSTPWLCTEWMSEWARERGNPKRINEWKMPNQSWDWHRISLGFSIQCLQFACPCSSVYATWMHNAQCTQYPPIQYNRFVLHEYRITILHFSRPTRRKCSEFKFIWQLFHHKRTREKRNANTWPSLEIKEFSFD